MKFSSSNRTDYIAVGVSTLIITACSAFLYADYARKVDSGDAKRIGTITFKKEVAQRKYRSQVIWEDLDRDAPVYNSDTIRTADLSEAVIKLDDGTRINVDENSLILLEMSGRGINIDFSHGSISADRGDVTKAEPSRINITSKDTVVSLDKADVKLSRSSEQGLDVTVTDGKAEVKAGSVEKTVQKDEKAIITKDAGPRVVRLRLKLLAPRHAETVITPDPAAPIRFAWSAVQGATGVYLEIARDANFTRGLVTRMTPANSFTENLGEGSYYWRVRAAGAGTAAAEYSDIRTINILRDQPVVLVYPPNNEMMSYAGNPPIINFRWRENRLASGYTMEISRDRSFSKIVQSIQTSLLDISLDRLEAGTYYWRVRTNSRGRSGTSPVAGFRIERVAAVKPPFLISPPDGRRVSTSMFGRSGGYIFSWSADARAGRYEFMIGSDREFRTVVARATVQGNYYAFRDSLGPGNYFWRVRAVDTGNGDTVSAANGILVVPVGSVVPGDPRVTATAGGPDDTRAAIRFPCAAPNFRGSRRVDLARDREFLGNVVSVTTTEDYAVIENIPAGAYFWRVRLYNNDRSQIGESEPRPVFVNTAGVLVGSAEEIEQKKGETAASRESVVTSERGEEPVKQERSEPARPQEEQLQKKNIENIERDKQADIARKARVERIRKRREELVKKRREEEVGKKQEDSAGGNKADNSRKRREELIKKRQDEVAQKQKADLAKRNQDEAAKKQQEFLERKNKADISRKRREEPAKKRREEEVGKKQEDGAGGNTADISRKRREELLKKRQDGAARKQQEELAWKRQEEIARKKQEALNKEAAHKENTTSLEIASSARGSAIYANSKLMGYDTAKIHPLPGKKLVISIKADGFAEYKQSLTMQNGEKKNINARLATDMPSFNEKHPGKRLRWKASLASTVMSRPVYRNKTMYVTTKNGSLVCLDMNGGQLWSTPLGNMARSTPAADDRAVYVVTVDSSLLSVDRRSGAINWKRKIEGPLLYGSEPVVSGGRIFVGTSYGIIQAFSRDGAEIWRRNLAEGIFSSMICDSGILYVGTDRSVIYAVSARDGDVAWTFAADSRIFSTSPGMYRGILYAGSSSGTLYAINRDGSLKWSFKARKAIVSAPAFFGDIVCFGSEDGMVYALGLDDGEKLWEFNTRGPLVAGPDIYQDSVLIPGGNAVFSIDVNSGELNWRESFTSGVNTPVTVVGNTAYVGLNNGDIVSLVTF